jgi:PAS domain S-box-containing protein
MIERGENDVSLLCFTGKLRPVFTGRFRMFFFLFTNTFFMSMPESPERNSKRSAPKVSRSVPNSETLKTDSATFIPGIPGFKSDAGFMESIPVPVFFKDVHYRFTACNKLFLSIFNYDDESLVIGRNSMEMLGDYYDECHVKSDDAVIREGKKFSYESRFPIDETGTRIAIITKAPLYDTNGNINGIIGVINDVSSLKALQLQQELHGRQLEETVEQRTAELEQKNARLVSEIAERIKVEQEMLQFESRLEIALKALRAGAWELEPQTGRLEWSEKCYDIFEFQPGPVTSEQWMSKVHPDDRQRVDTMWARLTAHLGWFELEFRIITGNSVRWIRKSGYYLKSSAGKPERVSGVMVDVTDEKLFNDRLLESQRFFKAIIEDQTELICRIRPDGKFTFVNQAFSRFFQIPAHVLLNLTMKELISQKDYTKIKRLLSMVKPATSVLSFDHRIDQPGREPALLQWTIRAIFEQDEQISEYQFVGRDVTEVELSREAQQKSEEKFRIIAENSNDIITIHTPGENIEYVSPSVSKILGYDAEDILSIQPRELLCEDDLPAIDNLSQLLIDNPSPQLATFRVRDSRGKLIWFESMIQPQFNQAGIPTGRVISVARDISSRKQAEEQQLAIERQLMDANLTKDKFFSIIAHDLRSPFTSILGFSRLLNDEYDDFGDEERKSMLQQILISTETTFQLLDNLLAWAKTQLGHTKPSPEVFVLDTLIRESVSVAFSQAAGKDIRIFVDDRDEGCKVKADLNMTKTVLRNLLSNAVKYSFEGGTVTIETAVSDGFASISVVDTGTGIDPDTLSKLFRLDEKVVSSKGTANEKGSGLGLILVKEFIERNGGTIFVDSKRGKGSRFTFTLPRYSGND